MVDTFDELGRAGRQAAQKAKRAPKENVRPGAADTISLDAAKARERLRDAEAALRQMQEQLAISHTGKMDFSMVRKIGAAESRVEEARKALRKFDPKSPE